MNEIVAYENQNVSSFVVDTDRDELILKIVDSVPPYQLVEWTCAGLLSASVDLILSSGSPYFVGRLSQRYLRQDDDCQELIRDDLDFSNDKIVEFEGELTGRIICRSVKVEPIAQTSSST